MKRHHIVSTTFASLGYDAERKLLEAEFIDGDVYDYHAVPLKLWRRFEAAPSKGKFFATYIRDHYAYDKVEQAQPCLMPKRMNS